MADGWRSVGRVAALYRHPIKSMAAQPMVRATIDRYGIAGDRRFALRRRGDESGFPWLTASKLPALIRYEVCCKCDDAPSSASMHLHSPDGDFVSCERDTVSRHFADSHGVDVELTHLRQGMFDIAGISVISTRTIASLGAMLSMPLDPRRFRPNVVIEVASSLDAFPEDAWVGSSLAFGDPASAPRVSVTELDERCAMVNLDPETGVSSPLVMRTIVRERTNFAGVYATPTHGGTVEVGDVAYIRAE